jgi:hypothetical protein
MSFVSTIWLLFEGLFFTLQEFFQDFCFHYTTVSRHIPGWSQRDFTPWVHSIWLRKMHRLLAWTPPPHPAPLRLQQQLVNLWKTCSFHWNRTSNQRRRIIADTELATLALCHGVLYLNTNTITLNSDHLPLPELLVTANNTSNNIHGWLINHRWLYGTIGGYEINFNWISFLTLLSISSVAIPN